jgi:hypothetical protein
MGLPVDGRIESEEMRGHDSNSNIVYVVNTKASILEECRD